MSDPIQGSAKDGPPPETYDRWFSVLADAHRRRTIECLHEEDGRMELDDLARRVARREAETGAAEIPIELVEQTRRSLYHTHLPKLADIDAIEIDQNRETAALTEGAYPLIELMNVVETAEVQD